MRHDPVPDRILWYWKDPEITEKLNNEYAEKITRKEIDEELEKERARFFDKR